MKSTITAVSPYGLTHVDVSAQGHILDPRAGVAYDIIFFYILLYLSRIIIKTLVILLTVFLRNPIIQFVFKNFGSTQSFNIIFLLYRLAPAFVTVCCLDHCSEQVGTESSDLYAISLHGLIQDPASQLLACYLFMRRHIYRMVQIREFINIKM